MGRSGDIGWGNSTYFGLPKRKKHLLTKEFLQTFKGELIKEEIKFRKRNNYEQIDDYDKETYDSFYWWITGSELYYSALKRACEKHNIVKAIYDYARKLPWYDSDCLEDDILQEMIKQDIIKK